MPMSSSWVERIFARLTIRYGAAFMRQWPDMDAEAVKADWADVLGNMPAEAIKYALDNLPETAPNAQQFRALCNRAPRVDAPQLPAPKADAEKVAGILGAAKAAHQASAVGTPAKQVLERICDIADKNGMSRAQRDFAKVCARMLSDSDPLLSRLKAHGVEVAA